MKKGKIKAVLDTNILVSAIIFSGIPQQVLQKVALREVDGITSYILLAELIDVLTKKFKFSQEELILTQESIKKDFSVISPRRTLYVVSDPDDNRILEAAAEGEADFIITGDKDLLRLKKYKTSIILTPAEFIKKIENKQGHCIKISTKNDPL